MSFMEKLTFFTGLSIIMGYPLICMLKSMQGFLLIVYIISSVGFFMTLKMFLCSQCINFACPLNGVIESVKHAFFERNPEVAEAWGEDGKH
jgi:hypothetical protein